MGFIPVAIVLSSILATIAGVPTTIDGYANSNPLVKIPELGTLKGQRAETTPSIRGSKKTYLSYTSIPYGQISQRFLPATLQTRLTLDDSVFDATQPQLACWQVPSPLVPGPFTEDCLTLNVYTPRIPKPKDEPLPVIFFIHGGSYTRWSGNMWSPKRLMNKDVVVVTINYRVNIFGFLCMENDEAPGNAGLYDQVLALQWVNKYISYFGGDPNKVTIAGQSAGAASVTYLIDSPMAAPLFHAAISSSGDDLAGWAVQNGPSAAALRAASSVGCYTAPEDTDTVLACLRSLPPATLMNANAVFYSAPVIQTFNLSTTTKVTPTSPYQALNGLQAPVPLMIGANKNDGSFLLSRTYSTFLVPSGLINSIEYLKHQFISDLLTSTTFGINDRPLGIFDTLLEAYLGSQKFSGDWNGIVPGLVDIFSVFYFKAAAFKTAVAHSKYADTYLHSFDYYGDQTLYPYIGGVPQVPRGVAHVDDMMYLWYFSDFSKASDQHMSDRMIDIWTNFATTFNPNGGHLTVPSWPKFTNDGGQYYKLNTIPSVGTDYINYWFNATQPQQ